MSSEPEYVAEGELIVMHSPGAEHLVEVLPKCVGLDPDDDDGDGGSYRGRWLCVTHEAVLPGELKLYRHVVQAGAHELAWFCSEHGIEAGQ